MEPLTLAEAARTVFLTIAPLIAGGALAKIGEDISDTAKDALDRTWQALEARFKRPLQATEKAELIRTAQVVEARLATQPKAARALDYFREDPDDSDAQKIVVDRIVDVFQPTPEQLIALAQAVSALQQPAAQPGARTVNISGKAQVGNVLQGDIAGDVSLGPIDFSRNKRIASPDVQPDAGASLVTSHSSLVTSHSSLVTRHAPLPPTLSTDGVHFTYGHALLIGVGAYQDPRLTVGGGTTANDARALGALLRDPQRAAYPDDQVRVLVDAKATRTMILDALEALAHEVAGTPDATALIFFAGHGERIDAGYGLLPYDTDLTNLAATAITAELFQRRIEKIRAAAKRLVVVLNCCHAGGVGDEVLDGTEEALSGAAPPPEFYRPLAVGSGQVVISSSRPHQKSGARSRLHPTHTTFGAHLLQALQGNAPGAGAGVGVFELFTYLRTHVPTDAAGITYRNAPLVQEPLFYASQLDDNLAVALRPAGSSGALSADADLIARFVALEGQLAADPATATPALIAERDALLARLG
jgi:hypothetical protein